MKKLGKQNINVWLTLKNELILLGDTYKKINNLNITDPFVMHLIINRWC